jgi:hypothetical protein
MGLHGLFLGEFYLLLKENIFLLELQISHEYLCVFNNINTQPDNLILPLVPLYGVVSTCSVLVSKIVIGCVTQDVTELTALLLNKSKRRLLIFNVTVMKRIS